MKSRKRALLEQIATDIKLNNVCPDLAREAKNLVIGDGNLDASIVFIGEAPGKKEDELGLPFVGASGKFLNEMLEMIGLKREDVYITNIVKYRPPDNRDPSKVEKELFLPYLIRQIQTIEPKVIVTLGRHSMDCFLTNAKISQAHGQTFQIELNGRGFDLFPLYHPAAAMYNGSLKTTLVQDFKKLSKFINQ